MEERAAVQVRSGMCCIPKSIHKYTSPKRVSEVNIESFRAPAHNTGSNPSHSHGGWSTGCSREHILLQEPQL